MKYTLANGIQEAHSSLWVKVVLFSLFFLLGVYVGFVWALEKML